MPECERVSFHLLLFSNGHNMLVNYLSEPDTCEMHRNQFDYDIVLIVTKFLVVFNCNVIPSLIFSNEARSHVLLFFVIL